MKLEYLAPYLPYKIWCKTEEGNMVITSVYDTQKEWFCVFDYNEDSWEFDIEHIKPILRPLFDLTKEIKHNGETFVPIDRIDEHHDFSMLRTELLEINPLRYPYTVVKYLISLHFDVFGLIEKGEAVDINTI